MSEKNRIKEVQKKLEETTNRSSELDAKLFESFKNGKTKEVDLDFVKVMSNSLRTTAKSAAYEILAYRVETNRIK